MPFTADHNGFFRDGLPFFPIIQDNASLSERPNTAVVCLPARLENDLNWSTSVEKAREYIALGKSILWEIDLGLSDYSFDPQDSAAFFSFTLALDEFSNKIWPDFHEQTLGIVLYRGAFNPAFSFPRSKWEPAYDEWLRELSQSVPDWHELKSSAPDYYALYAAQNLAEYLHRLVSFLPDAALPFIMIDVSTISSPAKIAQLFSKERYEHVHLILKGMTAPFCGIAWGDGGIAHGYMGDSMQFKQHTAAPVLGLYLPKDAMIDSSILKQLDQLISTLQTPFRIIAEEKLTEQWDGLDKLIVPAQAVSSQGKRKLLGFAAAGGIVDLSNL